MDEIYQSRQYSDPESSSSSSNNAADEAKPSKRTTKGEAETSTADYAEQPSAGRLQRSFSLDYRLCVPGKPKAGSYPAALLDALAGYLYLVRVCGFDPDRIVIAGDSAGGNLALALCRYLRDEEVERMPGALLLLSPWADVSRSHSGPTGAPNLMSSVYMNKNSDIISPSLAFRNTAVSAFLGNLAARETYRNPYLSSISLQLAPEKGGKPPHWGFEGFPKHIYITSGSAEISHDQHLTLAHRLAAGTKRGRPRYSGDKLSEDLDAVGLAARFDYPRPKDMSFVQSAVSTPLSEWRTIMSDEGESEGSPAVELPVKVEGGEARTAKVNVEQTSGTGAPTITVSAAEPDRDKEGAEEGKGGRGSLGSGSGSGSRTESRAAVQVEEESEREDREVVLDEVRDAIHDYLLFNWFEPERSQTWRRIAAWMDGI